MYYRTAQLYNQRKNRKGAYWEDRYHATAIESDEHLFQCLVYIDMNMVRAGVVKHPGEWSHSGYNEIQQPPNRYSIINTGELMDLGGFNELESLQQAHKDWVVTEIKKKENQRRGQWSDSVAVGSEQYIESVKKILGIRATGRSIQTEDKTFVLKEPHVSYSAHFIAEKAVLSD